MVREILIPTETTLHLRLPAEFVGKRIEVLAFEVGEPEAVTMPAPDTSVQRLADVRQIFAGVEVDLSNFKFDRNDANNYNDE